MFCSPFVTFSQNYAKRSEFIPFKPIFAEKRNRLKGNAEQFSVRDLLAHKRRGKRPTFRNGGFFEKVFSFKGGKKLFVAKFQRGEEIFSARKDDERTLSAPRQRAKIQKIPSFFETVDIHAGRIRSFVVGIFVNESAFEEKEKKVFDFSLIRFLIHARTPRCFVK